MNVNTGWTYTEPHEKPFKLFYQPLYSAFLSTLPYQVQFASFHSLASSVQDRDAAQHLLSFHVDQSIGPNAFLIAKANYSATSILRGHGTDQTCCTKSDWKRVVFCIQKLSETVPLIVWELPSWFILLVMRTSYTLSSSCPADLPSHVTIVVFRRVCNRPKSYMTQERRCWFSKFD